MILDKEELTQLVEAGYQKWLGLYEQESISPAHHICLLPHYDQLFSYYSVIYLNEFINKSNEPVIVITDNSITKQALLYLNPTINIIRMSNEEIINLLQVYYLYQFRDRLNIFSPVIPESRTSYNLVKHGFLSTEEYISIGILKNKNFIRAAQPEYTGTDIVLQQFFTEWKGAERVEL